MRYVVATKTAAGMTHEFEFSSFAKLLAGLRDVAQYRTVVSIKRVQNVAEGLDTDEQMQVDAILTASKKQFAVGVIDRG